MKSTTAARTLDGRGKRITTFVVYEASRRLAELSEGDELELLTDDFEPFEADVAAWCSAAGHRLVDTARTPGGMRFLIEKGARPERGKRLAMVISVAGLEELLSPLGFALAAALEGMEVDLYFQGPAVRVLARGYRPRLKGWSRPFSRFATAAMSRSGHIPPTAKLGQLRSLGAELYVCGPSLEHFRVGRDELAFEGLRVVEYLTFMRVMARADVQLYV